MKDANHSNQKRIDVYYGDNAHFYQGRQHGFIFEHINSSLNNFQYGQ